MLESVDSKLIASALERLCDEGWGHAKSRGLGRVGFTPIEPWQPRKFEGTPNGFVSLSHFCPAADNPTKGCWKIRAKHPVPPQFVDGKRVELGSGKKWRPQSILRLTPGSCFELGESKDLEDYYGRMISSEELLKDFTPDVDPAVFHYALALPWPVCFPNPA
jgi:CRISPR/Cas system CSM-associated protein Csm4 (group 5 of RAMP superfamily)